MDIEDEFEELVISSQSILPPKGASEIEIKMCQVKENYYKVVGRQRKGYIFSAENLCGAVLNH